MGWQSSDSLLMGVVEDWCCSYHFSDPGVSDHVMSGLVDGPSQTSHPADGDFALKGLGQGPSWALVYQGGGMKMELMSLAFVSMGIMGCQERGKMATDVICFLDSSFNLSVESVLCENAAAVFEFTRLFEFSTLDVDVNPFSLKATFPQFWRCHLIIMYLRVPVVCRIIVTKRHYRRPTGWYLSILHTRSTFGGLHPAKGRKSIFMKS